MMFFLIFVLEYLVYFACLIDMFLYINVHAIVTLKFHIKYYDMMFFLLFVPDYSIFHSISRQQYNY